MSTVHSNKKTPPKKGGNNSIIDMSHSIINKNKNAHPWQQPLASGMSSSSGTIPKRSIPPPAYSQNNFSVPPPNYEFPKQNTKAKGDSPRRYAAVMKSMIVEAINEFRDDLEARVDHR